MKRAFRTLFAALLVAFSSSLAQGWNRIGHMAVVGIAFDQLTPAEQAKLTEILSHLPNNDRMLTGLNNDATQPRAIVMAASTWPDLIKSDSARYYDNGYDEQGPLTSINASIGVKNGKIPMHKGWHFIDTPYNLETKQDGPALDDKIVNIVQALTVLDSQLKQHNTDAQERAYEMAWLLHLAGDVHQPLHCAEGSDAQNPKGDVGGNNIVTEDPITHEKELHAFWDDLLGKDTASTNGRLRLDLDVIKASGVIAALGKPSIPVSNATDRNFQKWADDTHKIAVDDVYKELRFTVTQHGEKDVDSVTIDENYHALATRIAQKQVSLAGTRLASLLKEYLKD